METQVLAVGGTQTVSEASTETGGKFTGGLLQVREQISGWEVASKLGAMSGEADIYIAEKDGQKGIIKYYRSTTKPKTEILEKIKGLKHPNIVNVFEFGVYRDRFYEIMEYAEGGALDSRNEDGSYTYLPLPEEKVITVCKEVLNSFKTCHEAGIIHRDIKPANIYYRTADGSDVVIADFGISSLMDEAEQLHKTRSVSRTTGYAAPEVFSGFITPKMDYYALGITLWELLTGKDPFVLDNGKQRNPALLNRDTIEGRIADDILSKEPRVSGKMERLIRGLLVIDTEHRWGYDEVTRHLAGEDVEVFQKQKASWSFDFGGITGSGLEELGSALISNPEGAKRCIYKGVLNSFLEDYYPDTAKRIADIAEESSANNDHYNGVLRVSYLLNPALPLSIAHGFKAWNIDDILFILENAPESALPLLRDKKSKLYTYLEIMGYGDRAAEIRAIPGGVSDAELAGKAEVLLRNKVIKPFKLAKYSSFELSTIEQLRGVPKDMQDHILTLIREKSYEGLFFPWLDLLSPKAGISAMNTDSWPSFLQTLDAGAGSA